MSSLDGGFPPADLETHERQWLARIAGDFYNVGPAIANYMICDWLLDHWRAGRVRWFTSFKADSVFEMAVSRGLVPPEAALDFVAFCRGIRVPEGFGLVSGSPCPPRVLNECIWIDGQSRGGSLSAASPQKNRSERRCSS